MRAGGGYFLDPPEPPQRRYEALRAYLFEGVSAAEAGAAARLHPGHDPPAGRRAARRAAVAVRLVQARTQESTQAGRDP